MTKELAIGLFTSAALAGALFAGEGPLNVLLYTGLAFGLAWIVAKGAMSKGKK